MLSLGFGCEMKAQERVIETLKKKVTKMIIEKKSRLGQKKYVNLKLLR